MFQGQSSEGGTFEGQLVRWSVKKSRVAFFFSLNRRGGRFIFFPGLFFIIFFLFWLIYGGLGFGVLGLGSYIGFLGLGFSVDGVWGLWCGAFWVFLGWGSLYKHKRITLGKKMVRWIPLHIINCAHLGTRPFFKLVY